MNLPDDIENAIEHAMFDGHDHEAALAALRLAITAALAAKVEECGRACDEIARRERDMPLRHRIADVIVTADKCAAAIRALLPASRTDAPTKAAACPRCASPFKVGDFAFPFEGEGLCRDPWHDAPTKAQGGNDA